LANGLEDVSKDGGGWALEILLCNFHDRLALANKLDEFAD
jgi:hypothetical protein